MVISYIFLTLQQNRELYDLTEQEKREINHQMIDEIEEEQ
ncbi:TPA: Rep protein [Staphylococcus aureus]|nr:Rep protein [Staphylococcus aureus]HDE0172846.1 Rep protein [Staphylococcus aureus]